MEIWKDIKGYEGLYQVSNFGEVKSLDRIVKNGNCNMFIKGRKLKQATSTTGYSIAAIQKNGKQQMKKVHRLVLSAFISNPLNKKCVNHINGIKKDNILHNLEWVTYKENTKHAILTGLTNDKKPISQIKDGLIIATFNSLSEASKKTNIQMSNISYCCSGARKNAGGYQWEYNKMEVSQ